MRTGCARSGEGLREGAFECSELAMDVIEFAAFAGDRRWRVVVVEFEGQTLNPLLEFGGEVAGLLHLGPITMHGSHSR